MLLDIGGSEPLLHEALKYNKRACIQLILSCKPTLTTYCGSTVFHQVTDATGLQYMLQYARDTNQLINIDFTDRMGYTPLMKSIRNGNYESTQLLLEYGADPDLKDHDGLSVRLYVESERMQRLIDLIASYDTPMKEPE
jgi:hypothetical protein